MAMSTRVSTTMANDMARECIASLLAMSTRASSSTMMLTGRECIASLVVVSTRGMKATLVIFVLVTLAVFIALQSPAEAKKAQKGAVQQNKNNVIVKREELEEDRPYQGPDESRKDFRRCKVACQKDNGLCKMAKNKQECVASHNLCKRSCAKKVAK
eukprot:TRINITY_DN5732_c0_g1_i1.p2 TRINITY_DN5732_c0_g1~~TRINITY_DN5732_c0_g1_i1.p2  ORF type:complete len:157 (+),score=30.85 TRINITY_DN5732_c0_g1_i1:39-509(+)